jgi:uncharacterized protein (TIGR03435 family)
MQRISRLKITGSLLLLSLTTSTGLIAQSEASDTTLAPSFEAATIKPNNSGSGGSSSGLQKGWFKATNVTIRGLLRFEAFMVADARIVGGPQWMGSSRFDIEARLDPDDAKRLDSLPSNQRNEVKDAIVQKLLADRFQLKWHWEDRQQSVYEIIVAKSGAKLQPAADVKRGSQWMLNGGGFEAKDVTITQVADLLTQGAADELGRVVVDRTGIAGAFDFKMKWTPDNGVASSAEAAGPSIFTAIQEQLGLKLEPAKAQVKVLVIDRLEMPSDN